MNGVQRSIPETIRGIGRVQPYTEEFAPVPVAHSKGRTIRRHLPHTSKVMASVQEAVQQAGMKSGMTISFHHHLRNGDYLMKLVVETLADLGIRDITIAASSFSPCHDFLIEYIEKGTVTALESSGLRGKLGVYLTHHPEVLKKPVIIRSHGGRARAIEAGELHIDVAFLGVPTCDVRGNGTGRIGKSAFGSMGYAMVDAAYADTVIAITDNLVDTLPVPYSIPQSHVDYVVSVEAIGDPEGIASGAIRITKNPVQLVMARYAAAVIDEIGLLKDGFSMQMGSGGASLAVGAYIREKMVARHITGSFGVGGMTGIFVKMLEEGLFQTVYDAQTFDIPAIQSIASHANHVEMSASMYASPWNASPVVNDLDVVFLSATEVDVDFNVNVITDSNNICMGASGGHSDAAAGADVTVIMCPVIRGRLPMIRDHVQTVVTPGDSIDIIVTDRGIAVNPKRHDLLKLLQYSHLPIKTIEELQALAYTLVGKPEETPVSTDDNDIVAVVEYRDGSVIDTIRKPLV